MDPQLGGDPLDEGHGVRAGDGSRAQQAERLDVHRYFVRLGELLLSRERLDSPHETEAWTGSMA